jgi:hypothetical protein
MWYRVLPWVIVPLVTIGCSGDVVIAGEESSVSTSTSSGDPSTDLDPQVFCDGYCKVVHDSYWSNCGDYKHCLSGCTHGMEDAIATGCLAEGVALYTCRAVEFGPDDDCESLECDEERLAFIHCTP